EVDDPDAHRHALLAFSPGGPGLPPFWVTAGLVAVALGALLLRRQRMIVAIGWGVALYGVLAAILVSRAGGWPGVPLAFAATGLLVLAGLTAHRLTGLRTAGGIRRLGAVVIAAVAFSTPLLAGGSWVWQGVRGPIGRVPDVMPELATLEFTHGERAVVVRGSGFTVLRGRTPLIGESELPGADARAAIAVAGLVGGRGGKDAATLARLGVGVVIVPPPVPEGLVRVLDSQPSLQREMLSDSGGMWRITEPVAQVVARPADALHLPWLWMQGVLTLLVLVMALPGRRDAVPAEAAQQPAPAPAGARSARSSRFFESPVPGGRR
ncbi:MAG: glycosyltransferase family 2 protein, partial [Nonomuraea sp.]|nr:glycosyltransferase family 2 protein [Nonomuraea sp.]